MADELAGREIDPESPDGLVSYLLNIARTDPRTMAALLGRVLPPQARLDVPELQRIDHLARSPGVRWRLIRHGAAHDLDAKPVEMPVAMPLPKPNGF